jgi:hypothetical protein
MNGVPQCAHVLSVYDALTEIASDKGGVNEFVASHPYIAAMAGCSIPTLKRALDELKAAGLTVVYTPKLRGQCTFSLLAVEENISLEPDSPAPNSIALIEPSLAPTEPTLAPAPKSFGGATVEEREKKTEKNIKNHPAARNGNSTAAHQGSSKPESAYMPVPKEW